MSSVLCIAFHLYQTFIKQAVRDLHADRIGHGFHLFSAEMVCGESNSNNPEAFIDRLTKYICDKRICLEVCLTSNLGMHHMRGVYMSYEMNSCII